MVIFRNTHRAVHRKTRLDEPDNMMVKFLVGALYGGDKLGFYEIQYISLMINILYWTFWFLGTYPGSPVSCQQNLIGF